MPRIERKWCHEFRRGTTSQVVGGHEPLNDVQQECPIKFHSFVQLSSQPMPSFSSFNHHMFAANSMRSRCFQALGVQNSPMLHQLCAETVPPTTALRRIRANAFPTACRECSQNCVARSLAKFHSNGPTKWGIQTGARVENPATSGALSWLWRRWNPFECRKQGGGLFFYGRRRFRRSKRKRSLPMLKDPGESSAVPQFPCFVGLTCLLASFPTQIQLALTM